MAKAHPSRATSPVLPSLSVKAPESRRVESLPHCFYEGGSVALMSEPKTRPWDPASRRREELGRRNICLSQLKLGNKNTTN